MGAEYPGMICRFEFARGVFCREQAGHPVHHGEWHRPHRPEPDHDFLPWERRVGQPERRRRISPEPLPQGDGLDVERLAEAAAGYRIMSFDVEGDGARYTGANRHRIEAIAAEYARLAEAPDGR